MKIKLHPFYRSVIQLFAFICFSQTAFADSIIEVYEDNPRTVSFESDRFFDSSSTLELKYQRGKRLIGGISREFLSKNVQLTITNPNFSGTEQTQAVFMNICTDRRTGNSRYQDVFWARLHWTGKAFESENYSITFDFTNAQTSYFCRQEIAAVSNGYWMRNKENGTNNFPYSMNADE
jgi:hypothetical protein